MGSKMRSEAEFRQSIESLLEDAETSVQTDVKSSERMAASGMSTEELDKYVRDLDLMISEEALITMRAQFLRFSSLFDTDQSRDVIAMLWQKSPSRCWKTGLIKICQRSPAMLSRKRLVRSLSFAPRSRGSQHVSEIK